MDRLDDILAALVAALMEDVPPLEGSQVFLRAVNDNQPGIRLVLADGEAFHIIIKRDR